MKVLFTSFAAVRSARIRSFYFFLIAFCLLAAGAQAQFQKPDVSMPSPNAASLGLYGEVPVSLYTGTPNIDIPLYTLEEGKIKVPISLSYHASGVRVNQHPGWVGLNWNLNAGGAITRVVRGTPDDYNDGSVKGFYFTYSSLQNSNWETREYVKAVAPIAATDTEPDEFKFNFLNFSGSFFINEMGKISVKSNHNLKVSIDELAAVPLDMQQSCGPNLSYEIWFNTPDRKSPNTFSKFGSGLTSGVL
jgi:hypothetical protein